jgi:hypothetical protein
MCVNDNKNVDLENPQIMRCIFCFNNLVNATNPRTQSRKGLISYYKTNGIYFFLKHVDAYHGQIGKIFEKEVNSLMTRKEEKQLAKKKANMSGNFISNFFVIKDFIKKMMCNRKNFWKISIF